MRPPQGELIGAERSIAGGSCVGTYSGRIVVCWRGLWSSPASFADILEHPIPALHVYPTFRNDIAQRGKGCGGGTVVRGRVGRVRCHSFNACVFSPCVRNN